MSSLSIIVPFRGVAESFEDTLISVLQNRPYDCDVVVVHAGPYGDPYSLHEEVTFVPAPASSSLVEQVSLGFHAATSDVVHVIRCGLEVEEGWTESAMQRFEDDSVAAVAPIVARQSTGQVVSAGVRSSITGARRVVLANAQSPSNVPRVPCDGPDLMAGFWRRSAWERAGGFDLAFGDGYADLDLALTLMKLGYAAVVEPQCRLVQTSDFPRVESSWIEGRYAERLFWKHAANRGWRGSVLIHAFCLAWEFLGAIPRPRRMAGFLGRTRALTERRNPAVALSSGLGVEDHGGDGLRRRDAPGVFPERRPVSKRNAIQPF